MKKDNALSFKKNPKISKTNNLLLETIFFETTVC